MVGGDFLDLLVRGRLIDALPGLPGGLIIHRLEGRTGVEPLGELRSARHVHGFLEIGLGRIEILPHQGILSGLEGEDPHVRVLGRAHVQDLVGQGHVVAVIHGDQGADLVGIEIARVELGDDGEDVGEIGELVRDFRVAIVLDGPNKNDVRNQGGEPERGRLEIGAGGDIDDARSGDALAGQGVVAELEPHGGPQGGQQQDDGDDSSHRSDEIPAAEDEYGQGQDEGRVADGVGGRGQPGHGRATRTSPSASPPRATRWASRSVHRTIPSARRCADAPWS